MRLSIIVAMSENNVIGKDNKLPWHLPADLKHFKQTTLGKPIIMGRKTFESIGRPLPDRQNIVVTRDKNFSAKGCEVVNSIDSALALVSDKEEVFVIGGAVLFEEMLPLTQLIFLTIIHAHFEGDTFFPKLNSNDWIEIEKLDYDTDDVNKYPYSFLKLKRKPKNQ